MQLGLEKVKHPEQEVSAEELEMSILQSESELQETCAELESLS